MTNKIELIWLIVGFLGQGLFFMRFLIQWIVSEKEKRVVVPISFWYCSIGGAFLLLLYALYRRDPVFIVSQSLGFFIYFRNLLLIHNEKAEEKVEIGRSLMIILGCMLLYLPGTLVREFVLEEPRFMRVAMEMFSNGDFFLPTFNGNQYMEKPPLYFLVLGGLDQVYGLPQTYIYAIPSIIAAIILVLMTSEFLQKVRPGYAADSVWLILGTSLLFAGAAQIIRMDMLFVLFICAGLFAFYKNYSQDKPISLCLFLFCGLGALVKGHYAVLLPMLTVILFLAFQKKLKYLLTARAVVGVLILVGVLAIWIVPLALIHGIDAAKSYVLGSGLKRFGQDAPHSQPVYYYLMFLPAATAPYLFILASGIFLSVKMRSPLSVFLLSWFLVFFIIPSLVTSKLPLYLLPLVPCAAMICALSFEAAVKEEEKWARIAIVVTGALLALMPLLLFFLKNIITARYHYIADDAIGGIIATLCSLGAAGIAVLFLAARGKWRVTRTAIAFGFGTAVVLFSTLIVGKFSSEVSLRPVAEFLGNQGVDRNETVYLFKADEANSITVFQDMKPKDVERTRLANPEPGVRFVIAPESRTTDVEGAGFKAVFSTRWYVVAKR